MRTESLAMSVSLLHGWLPLTVQAVAAAALVVAIGWRSRRWRLLSVPAGLAGGLAAALLIRWLINYHALAGDPAPLRFWLWIVLSGLGGRGAVVRLAPPAMVATGYLGGRRPAVPAVCGPGAQSLGGVLPDGEGRLGPGDRRAAAQPATDLATVAQISAWGPSRRRAPSFL